MMPSQRNVKVHDFTIARRVLSLIFKKFLAGKRLHWNQDYYFQELDTEDQVVLGWCQWVQPLWQAMWWTICQIWMEISLQRIILSDQIVRLQMKTPLGLFQMAWLQIQDCPILTWGYLMAIWMGLQSIDPSVQQVLVVRWGQMDLAIVLWSLRTSQTVVSVLYTWDPCLWQVGVWEVCLWEAWACLEWVKVCNFAKLLLKEKIKKQMCYISMPEIFQQSTNFPKDILKHQSWIWGCLQSWFTICRYWVISRLKFMTWRKKLCVSAVQCNRAGVGTQWNSAFWLSHFVLFFKLKICAVAPAQDTEEVDQVLSGGGNNKEYIAKQQRWLLFLRHCAKCEAEPGQCTYGQSCVVAKALWKHIMECSSPECHYPRLDFTFSPQFCWSIISEVNGLHNDTTHGLLILHLMLHHGVRLATPHFEACTYNEWRWPKINDLTSAHKDS